MTLSATLTARIKASAESVVKDPLDRFPTLVMYRCLEGATSVLASAASSRLAAGTDAVAETLTMPRRGFGPRPVEVLSPASRTLFAALVAHLQDALAEPSRRPGAWLNHRQFGRAGDHTHVVELDFAACYELIDHSDLQEELLLRSFDAEAVSALGSLLQGVGRHGRGLPQMLAASDRLADTYLSIIDRRLIRRGYELNRFADDIRVLASNWNEANSIIEDAANHARNLGLILSSAKTGVKRREVLDEAEERASQTLERYLSDANKKLSAVVISGDPYDPDFDVQEPDTAIALAEAGKRILDEWHELATTGEPRPPHTDLSGHVNFALASVVDHSEALPVDLLADLVFQDPVRLENVCRYLLDRRRTRRTKRLADSLLKRLCEMGRQSPWAKIWILHVVGEVKSLPPEVAAWLKDQLSDPHEMVRAEAAWACACHELLETNELEACYARATEMTAPALSAATSQQDKSSTAIKDSVARAIREDGPLNREAYKWAQS